MHRSHALDSTQYRRIQRLVGDNQPLAPAFYTPTPSPQPSPRPSPRPSVVPQSPKLPTSKRSRIKIFIGTPDFKVSFKRSKGSTKSTSSADRKQQSKKQAKVKNSTPCCPSVFSCLKGRQLVADTNDTVLPVVVVDTPTGPPRSKRMHQVSGSCVTIHERTAACSCSCWDDVEICGWQLFLTLSGQKAKPRFISAASSVCTCSQKMPWCTCFCLRQVHTLWLANNSQALFAT